MAHDLSRVGDEFREDAYLSRDANACVECGYEPSAPLLVVEWLNHLMSHEITKLRHQLARHDIEGKQG